MKELKRSHVYLIIALSAAIIGTLFQVYFILKSRDYDWLYFDGLALVLRSSILSYGTFPTHDPWVCSGTSILSNPQQWIFSPSMLLTLIFPPTIGNLLSIVLFKIFGFWGCVKYLRHQGVSTPIDYFGAALFVCSSWFTLHFAEGHIVFRSFYLLPFIFLYIETLDSRRSLFYLGGLFSLVILDGGFYALIFSLVYFCIFYAVSWEKLKRVVSFIRQDYKFVLLSLICFALIATPKLYPVLKNANTMKQKQERIMLDGGILFDSFFNPFISSTKAIQGELRFHEFSSYLGIALVALFIFTLIRKRWFKQDFVLLFLCGFFLWMATGFGGDANPYNLLSRIPLLNKAHIQTRYLIIFYLLFISLLCRLASREPLKKVVFFFLTIALVESTIPSYFAYPREGLSYDLSLIDKNKWTVTKSYLHKPQVYLNEGIVSKICYEPSHIFFYSQAEGDEHYNGNLTLLNGYALVNMNSLRLTPGEISFSYESESGGELLINTHYLDGWDEVINGMETFHHQGLLGVRLIPGKHEIVLQYNPPYYSYILIALILGLLLFILLRRRL